MNYGFNPSRKNVLENEKRNYSGYATTAKGIIDFIKEVFGICFVMLHYLQHSADKVATTNSLGGVLWHENEKNNVWKLFMKKFG